MRPGRKLRKWRKEKGLSLREVCERAGGKLATWHGWERGDRIPSADMALAIQVLTENAVCVQDWAEAVKERWLQDLDGAA